MRNRVVSTKGKEVIRRKIETFQNDNEDSCYNDIFRILARAPFSYTFRVRIDVHSGTFANAINETSITSAGGNTIIKGTIHETLTGGISGTRAGTFRLVIHPDGTLNAFTTGIDTVTIAGMSGTITSIAKVKGTAASVTGTVVLTDGDGGLEGFHGVLSLVGGATSATTFAGTYSGFVQFSSS